MKRSKKQLPSKANFSLFYNLTALIIGYKSVKDLRVTKIVKEIKFVAVRGELESKRGLQRQSFTGYWRLNLAFAWDSALRGKFWRGSCIGGSK